MKPFSPLTYLRENKQRCILLCCVFACIMVCYLGGLYITNPIEADKDNVRENRGVAFISSQEYRDQGAEGLKKVVNRIREADPEGLIMRSYSAVSFSQMTVLSYEVESYTTGFETSQEFEKYNSIRHIVPEGTVLKDGDIILTRLVADRIGVSEGDKIVPETKHTSFHDSSKMEFTVAAIIDRNSFDSYLVSASAFFDDRSLTYVTSSQEREEEMAELLKQLDLEYEDIVRIDTNRESLDRSKDFYRTYYLIFTCVIVLVACVLAITVNAILSGIYFKRRYEFAVYSAIGFSRREIRKKIAGEIICMNTAGLLTGIIITLMVIFFINRLVLGPQGMRLYYFNPVAFISTVLCDSFVVLPVILLQSKHMLKCSIESY